MPGDISAYGQLASSLGFTGAVVLALVVIWRGLFITKAHHLEVVKEKDAQLADKDRQLAEKDKEIARLERIYATATDYAQRRGDLLHQEKEQLLKQVDAYTQAVVRFTDMLGELRDAVRDLIRVRTAP